MSNIHAAVFKVLDSPSASRVDFVFGSIAINAAALGQVRWAIVAATAGLHGVSLAFANVPDGAAAAYDSNRNLLMLPPGKRVGATADDRATILHELVHAYRDIQGGVIYSAGKLPAYITRTEDEGAAYVAQALYTIYESGRTASTGTDMVYVKAYDIANKIVAGQKTVGSSDVMRLREYVATSPLYKKRLRLWTASNANGLAPPVVLPPVGPPPA